MSGTDGEEVLGTPPYRQRSSPSSNNECDDDDGTLNSSTSTAGPPGSQQTGHYHLHLLHSHHHHLWETGSNTSGSSPSSSTQRGYQRGGTSRRTGSYRAMLSGNRHSLNNRRSLSNTSTVASFMGSVPEWSRSFCLFNPVKAAASRHSLHFGHQLLLGGKHIAPSGGGGGGSGGVGTSSPAIASPAAGSTTPCLEQHRPSISFSMSLSLGFGPTLDTGHGGRSSSALFATGHPFILSSPSSPTMAAYYAMGGVARIVNKEGAVNLSPVRKELPMLLRSLCSYLSLTGTPIISGDPDHPMDTRKGPLIGVGGFAKVYAGIDCVSGNLVAIKEINIAEVNDHVALQTIGKEFELLKSLRHPNIVSYQLFKHSVSQKVCRIVMELLTGGSTLTLLEKYGPLREPVLRKFARHLLQAIAFIHKEGFTHRDIKPANILVSHNGVVKLCDFGCSKRVNELSKSTSCIIGTPLYMAPEFIKGEANHKSDIWSMACSLFELATGLLPWYHAGVRDNLPLMFYITTTSETPLVFPPKDDVQEFSPEFVDFMERCFTRDVSQRPEASELLKHPWIVGAHSSLLDPSNCAAGGGTLSPNWPSAPSPIDEELLCQSELEDVSAFISTEMCSMWMMNGSTPVFSLPVVTSQHPEMQSRGDDPIHPPLERRLLESQVVASNSQCHSPVVSSRGGAGGAPISPTASVDAALHDNFNYTMPLGSSAGCFVLPSCSSPAAVAAAPQYLRINPDGSLDFATAEEDDLADVDAEIEDALTISHRGPLIRSPSFNVVVGSGSPVTVGGGGVTVLSPSTTISHCRSGGAAVAGFSNTNNNNTNISSNSHSAFSIARSPAMRQTRHVSTVHNQSLSLTSNCSLPSRGVSPSRRSPAASSVSLTTSQQFMNLFVPPGLTPAQPMTSLNQSIDDLAVDVHGGLQHAGSVSRFPENVKLDTTGRLRMSLSVPNGCPERCVNISLSIDPEDVQRRIIEHRTSYVVSLSDDIKTQLTTKMQELASSGVSSPLDAHGSGAAGGMRHRFSRSTQGGSNMSVSPHYLSPSISPARHSIGGGHNTTHHSSRLKRGGVVVENSIMTEETGEVRESGNTNNNSFVGSFASMTHLSSDGEDRTPPLL